ncbi:ECF RNA polymerase sigma factor SigE [Aquisphaera giovannonii]|uniref:ECF RNA polymerase sigma factor SigE n=1 Tax=Aquisphaera giovannonii TaxID=406548 RepID=A0A5B9W5P5_9BACT|nr:RNA polymerase sigma factor [Aquisphaera giovannonii]QEH35972.1 ECF RNA polymerase sigma factor SigE [Aquisphaera giovannonii]
MSRDARALLDRLDRLFGGGSVAGAGEEDLLRRYARGRDEEAFAAIVARHGPMVLGVCRRLLRDERDAEDAFQATFLVLARRAAAIGDASRLGGWLHGVAHRVAVRARAQASRRFVYEQSAEEPVEPAAEDPELGAMERRELAAIVDEELSRLPATLRDPVVLCYLEGLTHDEAAGQLRWPVGTVRSRMARARRVLRARLARRGVVVDEAAIAPGLALARATVPPDWLAATVRGALEFATRPASAAAAIASARPEALARRTLQAMFITKLSTIGAAGMVTALTLAAAGAMPAFRAQEPPKADGDAPPAVRPDAADPPKPQAGANSPKLGTAEGEIRSLKAEEANLRDRLGTVESRLAELQAARQRSTPKAGEPGAAGPGDEDGGGRPTYAELGSGYLVISPDGSRVATMQTVRNLGRESARSVSPVSLPPIRGVRREVLIPDQAKLRPRATPEKVASASESGWFLALDLDRDRRVTRILTFNPRFKDGAVSRDIDPPIERSTFRAISESVCILGRTVFGFSETARRWGTVTLPPGVEPTARVSWNRVWGEGDRLFVFSEESAAWEDIYARAMEGERMPGRAPAEAPAGPPPR